MMPLKWVISSSVLAALIWGALGEGRHRGVGSEPNVSTSEDVAISQITDAMEAQLQKGEPIQAPRIEVPHLWNYESRVDPMTGKTVRLATIGANNEPRFPGRYTPTLTIRLNPDLSTDIMLQVKQGHFVCGVHGCAIAVRFDDGEIITLRAEPPSDHATDALILVPGSKVSVKLRAAKVMRVEATLFQQGNHIMTFDVGGLEMR
jgi:hypothetical protein